eukprot:CFRG7082T1
MRITIVAALLSANTVITLVTPDKVISSVMLLRHCVRSSISYPPSFGVMPVGFSSDASSYTAEKWPGLAEWQVKAGTCTELGVQYTKDVGKFLGETLSAPFQLVVDTTSLRDNQTADALIVGLNETGVKPDSVLYSNMFTDGHILKCAKEFNITIATEAANAQLAAYPPTVNDTKRMALVQYMLGTKGQDLLIDAPNVVYLGEVAGRITAACTVAETFLLERMSGMTPAWGKASDEKVLSMSKLCTRYWNLVFNEYQSITEESELVANMFSTLGTATGTTVYVGHDANIAALNTILGLQYVDPLYGLRASPPNSRLVFYLHEADNKDQYVTAKFFSIDLDGKETEPEGIPVTFLGNASMNQISYNELQQFLNETLIPACI